jgi:hypothetical protein
MGMQTKEAAQSLPGTYVCFDFFCTPCVRRRIGSVRKSEGSNSPRLYFFLNPLASQSSTLLLKFALISHERIEPPPAPFKGKPIESLRIIFEIFRSSHIHTNTRMDRTE